MNLKDISTYKNFFLDQREDLSQIISGRPPLKVSYHSDENFWEYFFDPRELGEKETLLLGGLCQLVGKKPPFAFLNRDIPAREIENFIRVENHQALFEVSQSDDELIENCLFRWAQHGFSQFLSKKMDNSSQPWPEKYLEKLQTLDKIINHDLDQLIGEFSLKVRMIALEGETVVVDHGRTRGDLFIPGLLQFLRKKFNRESLNIVAEVESPS